MAGCEGCGTGQVRVQFDGVGLCDSCADIRVAELTGRPVLGEPPGPVTVVAVDGPVRLEVRWWRAATGIVVELHQAGAAPGAGHNFELLGAHDAPTAALVDQLTEVARAELGRRYLEPDRHRAGWTLEGDEVAGRLEWNDADPDGPYNAVVDGRSLPWDELGMALRSFEGWRFRLIIEDRLADVRPDADIVALVARPHADPAATTTDPATSPPDPAPPTLSAPDLPEDPVPEQSPPTIDRVLAEFLADTEQRLAARTFRNYAVVVDLLRDCLNGYGHTSLDAEERARWEAAYAADEDAFVRVFGPDKIADNLGEFLGYFMIRKVMAGDELLRAAGTVTKKLAGWLGEHGYLDPAAVADAVERGGDAARDLPRAEKLSRLLFDHAAGTTVDMDRLGEDDIIEDYLTVEKVAAGALWFEDGIGPVKVPAEASKLAQPGWQINVTLARAETGWKLVEVGNVYP